MGVVSVAPARIDRVTPVGNGPAGRPCKGHVVARRALRGLRDTRRPPGAGRRMHAAAPRDPCGATASRSLATLALPARRAPRSTARSFHGTDVCLFWALRPARVRACLAREPVTRCPFAVLSHTDRVSSPGRARPSFFGARPYGTRVRSSPGLLCQALALVLARACLVAGVALASVTGVRGTGLDRSRDAGRERPGGQAP